MKLKKPEFWDYKKPNLLSYLLFPFTLPIYLNNLFPKKIKVEKDSIKKICVGNIYLGGTGKTPLTIMISNIISNDNKTAIIKKFYKDQVDEQNLIKKYAKLICKKKRIDALKYAKSKNFDCVIFDDGLQDKSINYDLKIVCFNNLQWIGNGFLIPAGPLRENINSLKKYDMVVINGDSSKNDKIVEQIKKINYKLKIFESYYEPSNLKDFDRKKNFIAFSGIGNNKNFIDLLINNDFKIVKKFYFPDHYNLTDFEINNIIKLAMENKAEIITTEKDFFRLSKEFQEKIKFLKLEIKLYNYKKFSSFFKKIL